VIEVTAPAEVLAARLASRRRENAADIAERLARNVPLPSDIPVDTVVNDGSLELGIARFLAALNRAVSDVPR
jgi:ribose 1,5-bisphosphokinase PhnN